MSNVKNIIEHKEVKKMYSSASKFMSKTMIKFKEDHENKMNNSFSFSETKLNKTKLNFNNNDNTNNISGSNDINLKRLNSVYGYENNVKDESLNYNY